MWSSLLRPGRGKLGLEDEASPQPGPSRLRYSEERHATADFTEADDDDDEDEEEEDDEGNIGLRRRQGPPGEEDEDDDEDGEPTAADLLPLFSSSHLDSLPVYSITHAIRVLVLTRTETTLSWDQLRSPQVSQFLVKPIQQQIRNQHFSRATIYALMANCLQFAKEGQLYPGNAGTSITRSRVCELLGIKLLKEYTTRELIDALSYDFYPLQGLPGVQTPIGPGGEGRGKAAAARTSTLEVAIRASAKHFLAHPLVVQQLEAIWNGAISFYSSADRLHKQPSATPIPSWGAAVRRQSDARTPLLGNQSKQEPELRFQLPAQGRRTVTLYNPRNASLFKLSRLRVPRYRQFLSTLSLAVLIGLFLAVLVRRSKTITTLELVFWFWSAGFMLDELVGFTEQGFSLYIMSFWNIFDLGILLLLVVYYGMRICGVFLVEPQKWNENAYDVLAANAILLLPRIFSVLDHYQYFSQLLIAFRLMAVDLAAVFVLILVSCSGFFVFFTLSRNENDPAEVAYRIFQILMGFTPAAWEVWPSYNWLGKSLMGFFLIICHFVVVTILITVLTNSFMSIASNASEEHQFLFAINTISMVKNDALFSYIAPGNIFAWALMPLRYCLPLRQFVQLNRVVIKATHFPLLFCIYLYERFWLAPTMFEPTDLVENPGRGRQRAISLSDPAGRTALFSPNLRVREESVVGYQKDRALEEVFRRIPDAATLRTQRRNDRRKTHSAIRNWMDQHNGEFPPSPRNYPAADSRAASNWQRKWSMSRERPGRFRQFSDARSVASDPADLMSNAAFPLGPDFFNEGIPRPGRASHVKDDTDADGGDELVTNDEEEEDNVTNAASNRHSSKEQAIEEDYFTTPVATRFATAALPSSIDSSVGQKTPVSPRPRRATLHNRTMSTNTILYRPQDSRRLQSTSSPSPEPSSHTKSRPLSSRHTPAGTPTTAVPTQHRSPRRSMYQANKPRPILTARETAQIVPKRALLQALDIPSPARQAPPRRRLSVDLDASSELNAAMAADHPTFGGVPSSFATQMAMATGMMTPMALPSKRNSISDDINDRLSRLMLAKMKTMEESLADVVREVRVLRTSALPSTAGNSGDDGSWKRRSFRLGSGSTAASAPGEAAFIEVAGRERGAHRELGLKRSQTTAGRLSEQRPGSRRSLREEKKRSKGKGRQVQQSDADDDMEEATGVPPDVTPKMSRRGSSF